MGFQIILGDEEVCKQFWHLQRIQDFHLSRICKNTNCRKANADFSHKPVSVPNGHELIVAGIQKNMSLFHFMDERINI